MPPVHWPPNPSGLLILRARQASFAWARENLTIPEFRWDIALYRCCLLSFYFCVIDFCVTDSAGVCLTFATVSPEKEHATGAL